MYLLSRQLPQFFLSPLVGVLADRYDRRILLIIRYLIGSLFVRIKLIP